jgi:hypothetical protein
MKKMQIPIAMFQAIPPLKAGRESQQTSIISMSSLNDTLEEEMTMNGSVGKAKSGHTCE